MRMRLSTFCCFICLLTHLGVSYAGESGFSNYLPGFRDTLAGTLPGPGLHLKQYFFYYSGSIQTAVSERMIETDANLELPILISAFNYVTKERVLGGRFAYGIIVPALNTHISGRITSPGPTREFDDSITSLGDIVLQPAVVAWQKGYSHHKLLFLVYLPTGNYDVNREANTSLNRWALELDYAYTWLDLKRGLELSISPGYTVPFRNTATDYLSGQEFHVDYTAIQRFRSGFGFGVVGYIFQQITRDKGTGAILGPFKGRVYGIGPIFTYEAKTGDGKIVHYMGKYLTEFGAANRFEGDSGWITVGLSF
jgi:hypothetical protein